MNVDKALAGTEFWEQWKFWRNLGVIITAIFVGILLTPQREPSVATQPELEQEIVKLRTQVQDYQAVADLQKEMIAQLKKGNQELEDKLQRLQADLQRYRQK